jgi:hypothetical protein
MEAEVAAVASCSTSEQNEGRALPLAGRPLALELLLRVWQRSGEGADTAVCLEELWNLVSRAWRITIARHEPVMFVAWP